MHARRTGSVGSTPQESTEQGGKEQKNMPERGMAGGAKLEHEQQRKRVAARGGDARWLRGVREMVRSLLTPDHLCKRWLASLDAFSDGSAVANIAVSGISCTALADATVPSSYAAEVSSQHFAWSSGHRPSV